MFKIGVCDWCVWYTTGLVPKSCPTLATPWTVAGQTPLSMGFLRQEYWSGLPFPAPGNLPNSEIEPGSLSLLADSLPPGCRDMCVCVFVTQLCLILCNAMDCSLPGSSVHGISQARILEWVAISFSRGFYQPRDQTYVSCIAGGFFTADHQRSPYVINTVLLNLRITQLC